MTVAQDEPAESWRNQMKIVTYNLCRSCLNRKYRIALEREDCVYEIYPHRCMRCGKVRSIVVDLRLKAKIRLMFR